MTIPKITPYSGGVANPDGSQTQTEFTQSMFDQLSYEAELSTELNSTVDGINETAIQVDADATSAAQSAASADAAASGLNYQGLWPDTDGGANKGDTYQTQISGTPTGRYFTALQNTTVSPVGDDMNWREVVSQESLSQYTDIVYKASGGNSAVENMILGSPFTTLMGQTCQCENGTIFKKISESFGGLDDFQLISMANLLDFGYIVGQDNSPIIESAVSSLYPDDGALFDDNFNLVPFTDSKYVFPTLPANLIASGSRDVVQYDEFSYYSICKGSYGGLDNPFVTGYRVDGDELLEVWRLDLPTGSTNSRNIFTLGNFLYIYEPQSSGIKIYKLDNNTPVFIKDTDILSNEGLNGLLAFKVIGNIVIVSGWSNAKFAVVKQDLDGTLFVSSTLDVLYNLNADIVDMRDGSYVCLNHSEAIENVDLCRFWVDNDEIVNLQYYGLGNIGNLRRGNVYNGKLYTISYGDSSTLGLLEVSFDVTGTPSVTNNWPGIQTSQQLDAKIGDFILDQRTAYNLKTGEYFEIFPEEMNKREFTQGFGKVFSVGNYGAKSPSAEPNDGSLACVASLQSHPFIESKSKESPSEILASEIGDAVVIKHKSGILEIIQSVDLGRTSDYTYPTSVQQDFNFGFVGAPSVSASITLSTSTASSGNTSLNVTVGGVTSTRYYLMIGRSNTDFLTDTPISAIVRLSGRWK